MDGPNQNVKKLTQRFLSLVGYSLAVTSINIRGRLHATKDVRQMGREGGFEISDIPGRGEGVVCESSDVRKFLKKSKFQNFSEFFKVKTRNYNRSKFQYESILDIRCIPLFARVLRRRQIFFDKWYTTYINNQEHSHMTSACIQDTLSSRARLA